MNVVTTKRVFRTVALTTMVTGALFINSVSKNLRQSVAEEENVKTEVVAKSEKNKMHDSKVTGTLFALGLLGTVGAGKAKKKAEEEEVFQAAQKAGLSVLEYKEMMGLEDRTASCADYINYSAVSFEDDVNSVLRELNNIKRTLSKYEAKNVKVFEVADKENLKAWIAEAEDDILNFKPLNQKLLSDIDFTFNHERLYPHI